MTYFLSIDPGKTTGWASFTADGSDESEGQVAEDRVEHLLDTLNPRVIIMEDFRLYPWKAQQLSWQKMNASKVIGVIENWVNRKGVRLEKVSPDQKSIAYTMAGRKVNSNHDQSHHDDAYCHGFRWLMVNEVRKPTGARRPPACTVKIEALNRPCGKTLPCVIHPDGFSLHAR